MNAEEYTTQIMALLATDLDQAMKVCQDALSKHPDTAQFYYLKALILWNQSEVFNVPREEFSTLLKKATDLDPHYSEPHLLWAYANELLGYPEMALRGYQRAVEADPQDLAALDKLGEMEQKLGHFPAALQAFDKLISLLPSPSDAAYNSRGHIRREMKDYAGAIEDFNKALEVNPGAGGSVWGRGLCKKGLGDLAGAAEDFSQFITLFPTEIFGYMERAAVKVLQNDLIGALKDYQTVVLQIDTKNETAWGRIAELQNQLVRQIPENAAVLHATLKSGLKATTVPINGQSVLFLDMPQAASGQPDRQAQGINTPDPFGETPLTEAVKKGQVDEVKKLIALGADVNFVNRFDDSILMVAVQRNQPEVVKLLVEAGADVNFKGICSQSILRAAERKGYAEIVDILKSAGAKE